MTDPSLLESLMKEVTEEIRKLWDTLMGLEMELVDQLEVMIQVQCLSSGIKSLLNETQRMTNTECSSRFFTEIHVYQSSIFLFPRLLFPSLFFFH